MSDLAFYCFQYALALLLAPLLPGIIARIKAKVAGRHGKPVLQLYFDIFKGLRKGEVISQVTTPVFTLGPVVGLATVLCALALLPLGGMASPLRFSGDFLLAAYLLGLYLAQVKGAMFRDEIHQVLDSLKDMPRKIQWVLDTQPKTIQAAAERMVNANSFLFLGRHVGYPVALEGALKLKEIAYVHSEAYPAGELKHGPISLIEEETLVVALATVEKLFDKTMANVREVKARGAHVLGVTTEDFAGEIEKYADRSLIVPKTHPLLQPSLTVIPLQAFAYYIALARGCDVDMPRNLAKSVTVE